MRALKQAPHGRRRIRRLHWNQKIALVVTTRIRDNFEGEMDAKSRWVVSGFWYKVFGTSLPTGTARDPPHHVIVSASTEEKNDATRKAMLIWRSYNRIGRLGVKKLPKHNSILVPTTNTCHSGTPVTSPTDEG